MGSVNDTLTKFSIEYKKRKIDVYNYNIIIVIELDSKISEESKGKIEESISLFEKCII